MAKSKIPDPLARRHLIEREQPPAQSLRLAEAYLAEGRTLEAVEFLRKAGEKDKLAAIRAEAVAAGDSFLVRIAAAALGEPVDRESWRQVAGAAEAAGKQRYAADARRQAARGED
jgi:hypothetical protein